MKTTIKFILLLGAVVTVGVIVWLGHQRHSTLRETTERAATTAHAIAPSPAVSLAQSAPSPMPAVPAVVPERMTPVSEGSYAERVKVIQAKRANLTDDEVKAFYAYLRAPAHPDLASRSGENWLRNVMLDRLVEQPTLPAGLPGVLVSIYQDQEQDAVMRDYAIQHMDPAYDRTSTEDKALLRQVLWQATGETDSSIAGTALLALSNLAQSNAEFDQNQIAQTALKLASDEQCGELARITALQLCAQMGVTQAASLALQLAQGSGSMSLRISAIAALGNLGGPDTETFLQDIAAGNEDRLKPAAETALKRLEKRLGT